MTDYSKEAFDRLKAAAQSLAKPNLTPSDLDRAFGEMLSDEASPPSSSGKMAPPSLSVAFLNEQGAYHQLQERGEIVLYDKYKPSASPEAFRTAYNGINQGGFDSVSIGLGDDGQPMFYYNDNKSLSSSGNINSASAFEKHGSKNRNAVKESLDHIANDSEQPSAVQALARFAAGLIEKGRDMPRLLNCGGNSRGSGLAGVGFQDLNDRPDGRTETGNIVYDRSAPTDITPKGAIFDQTNSQSSTAGGGKRETTVDQSPDQGDKVPESASRGDPSAISTDNQVSPSSSASSPASPDLANQDSACSQKTAAAGGSPDQLSTSGVSSARPAAQPNPNVSPVTEKLGPSFPAGPATTSVKPVSAADSSPSTTGADPTSKQPSQSPFSNVPSSPSSRPMAGAENSLPKPNPNASPVTDKLGPSMPSGAATTSVKPISAAVSSPPSSSPILKGVSGSSSGS